MWKFSKYSSIIGLLILVISFIASRSASQQAAGAAVAVAISVIPYCLARAQDFDRKNDSQKISQDDIDEFLKKDNTSKKVK